MTCDNEKKNFILTLMDGKSFEWGQIIVQSECSCNMQEWITELSQGGGIIAHSTENSSDITMTDPVVILVEDRGKVRSLDS